MHTLEVPALVAEIRRLETMLVGKGWKYARCGACQRVRKVSEMSSNCHKSGLLTCPESPCRDAFRATEKGEA